MKAQHISIFFTLFLFGLCLCSNAGSSVISSSPFQSFVGDDFFVYKSSFQSNSPDFPICSDEELEIACYASQWYDHNYFSGETYYYATITCSSYTSSLIAEISIDPQISPSRVAYNYPKHSLIYWDETGKLTSYNLATNETVFAISENCTNAFCYISTTSLNNGDFFYFYTTPSNFYVATPTLQTRNSTTGEIVASSSIDISYFNIYDFGENIAVGIVFFDDDTAGFSILNPITLATVCEAHTIDKYDISIFYGSNNYINVGTNTPDLYTYGTNCTFLWRIPVSYIPFNDVAYDYKNNFYAFTSFSELINNNLQFYYKIYQIPLGNTPPDYENLKSVTIPYEYEFAGIDSTSTLFFTNGTPSEFQIFKFPYDSFKNNSKPDYTIELDSYPFTNINLISSGVQIYIDTLEYTGIISIQSTNNEWWRITDIMTYIFLPITFLFSMVIMVKHAIRGDDGKGWHKSKILDVLNSLLLIFSIIFITITISIAQIQLVNDINDNTGVFSLDLGEFYQQYLESPGVTTSTDIGLCTCDDENLGYSTNQCVASSCGTSSPYCDSYLHNTNDCYHSIYQWNCANCIYLEAGTCTMDFETLITYNPEANEQWEQCQHYYSAPTLLLNINFYILIFSAIIICSLNLIQILLKYDVVLFDLTLTIVSIFIAFLQFLIVLIGTIYVSLSGNGDCISSVVSSLPGCVLVSNQVITSESLANTYLQNAYSNLYSSPIMFIISAIPDLVSILCCTGLLQIYKLKKGYETIDDSKSGKANTFIPLLCCFFIGIISIIIFLIAGSLFFTSLYCSQISSDCNIDPIILNWFFIIGLVPGAIISCCLCLVFTLIGLSFFSNK